MTNITVGQKVKFFRLKAGFSQFGLEIAINASTGVISRLESDRVNPTKETLFAIAQALDLDKFETAYLFGILEKQDVNILESQQIKFVL